MNVFECFKKRVKRGGLEFPMGLFSDRCPLNIQFEFHLRLDHRFSTARSSEKHYET